MALEIQKAVFPLAKGIDTKTDPKQLVAGVMQNLENAQLASPGQYIKRNGYESLASIDNPKGLGNLNDELVMLGNNSVYSYSPGSSAAIQTKTNQNSNTATNFQWMQLDVYKGLENKENHTYCDSAYHSSGRQAFISVTESNNQYFTIIDYESNATLYNPITFTTGATTVAKVMTLGGYFVIFYANTSTSTLRYIAVPINTTSGALPAAVTIATNLASGSETFDVCNLEDVLYIVWGINGAGLGVASLDSALGFSTTTALTGDTVSKSVACFADETASQISIAYYNGMAVRFCQINTTLSITTASLTCDTLANVINVAVITDNNSGYVYYEISGSGTPADTFFNNYIKRSTVTAAVPATGASWLRSVGIVSKPFYVDVNDEVIVGILVGYTGAQPQVGNGTVFIVNTSGVIIGKFAPGNCYGISNKSQGGVYNAPSEVNIITDTLFTTSFLRADFSYANNNLQNSYYGSFGATFDFDSSLSYVNATAASNLHITGGILGMYDGQNFVEHGYNNIPESPTAAVTAYDGSHNFFPTGTYSYIIVYEWFDAQGSLHVSVPSTAYEVSTVSPITTITLTIPTLRITQKGGVYLSVFRNTLAAPTIFNRVEPTLVASQLNSTTTDSISFIDDETDAAVEQRQLLYTTGGVLPDYSVPSPKFVVGYRNRLVVLPAETPNILWISKNILQGIPSIPVEFSAFLVIQVNTLGGDINAFIQMDEKGIIFKENSIFYFVGDGPSDTGANNDISIPQQIPSDVGCVSQRSVVVTPNGAIFKSTKGIYLLDRSLNVVYIGQQVEAYNSAEILSADLVPNMTQVRFLLDTGVAIVYDYLANQWFTYKNHSGVDAAIYQNLYTYLRTDGNLYQETPAEYTDNGAYIPMRLVTGWLSFAGIQGYQRFYDMLLLGTYINAHNLHVTIAYDFNPNPIDDVTIDVPSAYQGNAAYGSDVTYGDSSPYGGDYIPVEQFEMQSSVQLCESIQVTIEDAYLGVMGEGFRLSSLGFEIGIEPRLMRLPAVQKFG